MQETPEFLEKMSTNNHATDSHTCCSGSFASPSVHQTMDELDFDRGIWSAAVGGDLNKVKHHLDQGTNSNEADNFGYTALHYACRHGKYDVCKLLLKHGADCNCCTRSGRVTPLHRAAYTGHLNIVELLLKHQADPNMCDSDGKCALHKAVEGGHAEIVRLLLSKDPDTSTIKDNKNKVPIDYLSTEKIEIKDMFNHVNTGL